LEVLVGNSEVEKELELSQGEAMSSTELGKALEEIGEEEEVSKEDGSEVHGVEQLAAIPEALLYSSSVRRSKRRAGKVDELVGLMTERRKTFRNEGIPTNPDPTNLALDSEIISNLHSIGVSLGQDSASVNMSLSNLKSMASINNVDQGLVDRKTQVLVKDQHDRLEEEELDKMFLKNICSEIMEEVMDMGSDLDVILPRGSNKKSKLRRGKKFK
jgi:hypothetical protein